MTRGITILTSLLITAAAVAQPQMPAPILSRIKDATVYVKVQTPGGLTAGSGFLFERQGRTGIVVTNAHVVGRDAAVGSTVQTVFFSGTPNEEPLEATVVALDSDRDLALLKVTAARFPIALNRVRSTGLTETMPVYAVGFPFGEGLSAKQGNPEVTLTAGTISSLRKDDFGNLVAIQVNGGINPGNSGGPLVDARGDLIGIAVAMVSGTQIGLAIPGESLGDMLQGRVVRTTMAQQASGNGWVEVECTVELIDPMAYIQRVSVLYLPRSAHPSSFKARDDGRFDPMEGAREQALKIKDQMATGTFRINLKNNERLDYYEQIKCVRRNFKVMCTQPVPLTLRRNAPPVAMDRPRPPGTPRPNTPPTQPDIDAVPTPMKPTETAPAAEEAVTKLAAPIEDLAVAGMGRYLVCKLKDIPGLTVYDGYTAKVARTLRLPSAQFKFAAGGERAIVYLQDENLVQTWDLTTGEKLKTKPNPFPQTIGTLVMGHGREDQAVVLTGERSAFSVRTVLLDLNTLQPLEAANTGRNNEFSSGTSSRMRANFDLSRIGATRTDVSPSGMIVMRRAGNGYDVKYEHNSEGVLVAGDDGRIYTASGRIYTSDLVKVGEIQGNLLIPAIGGGFVMAINDQGRMALYEAGKTTPLTPWGQFPGWSEKSRDSWQKARWGQDTLILDRHIVFAPNIGRIMVIPLEADSIMLQPFDLKATLDKTGIDYLVVTSTPSTEVKRNQQWQYQLDTISKAGGIKYDLELAPPGMTISETGLINWKIPASLPEAGEKVIVLVSDGSGEQTYHTFTLRLASRVPNTGTRR